MQFTGADPHLVGWERGGGDSIAYAIKGTQPKECKITNTK